MSRRVNQLEQPPLTLEQLANQLPEIWQNIPQHYINNLIRTMPNRVIALRRAIRGGPTSARNVKTLKEKVDVIEIFNKDKLSVRDLAKRFGIGKTQAADIIKNKDVLLSKFHSNINVNEKRSFLREESRNIDRQCYEWFIRARSKNIPLSGTIVKTKAKEIADGLGYRTFSASEGWLQKFRTRHNIAFRTISGEAASVNSADVTTFWEKVPSIIKNYAPKNIYNADETGLFFRAVPNRTHLKRERCIGGKFSKERLTILFCVNIEGHKERPLVIGKMAKPRAFKNINVKELPVTYRWNKKAWMTGELMAE
ncbi:tigger transposable element-derived protein 4-like [Anthonomus grandis grandis]|uniref:tigger transposable element-derived protein 4-like n=1 Tax=Anthonomus grandis grandis TaxID=2921223 RepID=UPI0021659870|nr:tigger transposable element-derived protein 4-like [Anthonomus grandis grandis]